MPKTTINTFQGGMVKDLDKSLISKERYLESRNFRLITSTGESTGALENIEGNNNMASTIGPSAALIVGDRYIVVKGIATYRTTPYTLGQDFLAITDTTGFTGSGALVVNVNHVAPAGMYVAGSVNVRGTTVLFLTNNSSASPTAGRSMIVKFTIVPSTETITGYSVLYDDNLNNQEGYLKFSTANNIRAVGVYETPTVQKIYWCDNYNNVRYANICSYLTTDGLVKSISNYYFKPDLFEFIPEATLTKPTLDYLSPGAITAGVVQYAFQYYTNHGTETRISPLSNTIHITTDNDYLTTSYEYKGEGDLTTVTGKSVRMNFSIPDSDKFNNIRVIRLFYKTINSVPTITVVGEVPINSTLTQVSFLDVGTSTYGTLTLDEFNLGETELFSARDITIKNERLFAANIKKEEFSVGSWDARAIRFRNYTDAAPSVSGTDTTTPHTSYHNGTTVTFIPGNTEKTYQITISNFATELASEIPVGRTVTDVTAFSTTRTVMGCTGGLWHDASDNTHSFNAPGSGCAFFPTSFNSGSQELVFTITTSGADMWDYTWDHMGFAGAFDIQYTYSYTTGGAPILYEDSIIYDGASTLNILKPTNPALPADWVTARWDTATTFPLTHDAINPFNDPANDGVASKEFQYQADAATLGAEGPNIKIGFTTDGVYLDRDTSNQVYAAPLESTLDNKSYTSFASPYMSGRRSWQRDEVYRLYIVFFDAHGTSSSAKWICDLRMPSFHNQTGEYSIMSQIDGEGDVWAPALYPTVTLKSLPTGAVSAQLLRVERGGEDRSVLTQALVVPTGVVSGATRPREMDTVINIAGGIVKLVSPEINITKNISKGSSDYLDYLGNYNDLAGVLDSSNGTWQTYHKCVDAAGVVYNANNKAVIDETTYVDPRSNTDTFSFHATTCANYDSAKGSFGSSGLFVHHTNGSWAPDAESYAVVNYKRDVHESQYGGQTFESREGNIAIPASDMLTAISTEYTAWNGDTFINFFDVSTSLFDLTKAIGASFNENVFIPLESSINCDLRHDRSSSRAATDTNSFLIQEVSGEMENVDGLIYSQKLPLYQYNTVYSQDSTAKFYINIPSSVSVDTDFDCMVKVSKVKLNGESQDSFTLFPVNDFIEVSTNKGAITTLKTVNDKLLFWQENAFGALSVNDRSLIQDSGGAALVLGTGGVLDRYDYISDNVGATDNHHVVSSQTGVYWLFSRDRSIYRFAQNLQNISKSKLIQSFMDTTLTPTSSFSVNTVYDSRYNQVLFTINSTEGTLVFDENIDAFSGFYDFTTPMFIPHLDGFLSTCYLEGADQIFYHNSQLKDRCCFYSLIPSVGAAETLSASPCYEDSSVKVVFNDGYASTKVFDNFAFVSTTTLNSTEIHNNTFHSIRCYNNYQNTDTCDLVYGTNLERDEREWTTFVPRNAVTGDYDSNPNIISTDKNRTFRERMRDKYMITDFTYANTSNRRFVVPYVAVKYRISPR